MDWVLCKTAGVTFNTIQHFNKRNPNPSVTPQWSDKPLLKSWEKTKPTLGLPRQTDSLCPACVKEAREAIIAGKKDWRDLMHEKVGEIKAQIIERDGQVWMVKDCPTARPLRRHDGHRRQVPRSGSKRSFPAATFRRTTTKIFTTTAPARCATAAARFSPWTSRIAAT